MSSVQSVLLYGAEVWMDALNKEVYWKQVVQVKRRDALRDTSVFCMVSELAVLVIARVIPISVLAQEHKPIYQRKKEAGQKTAVWEEGNYMIHS